MKRKIRRSMKKRLLNGAFAFSLGLGILAPSFATSTPVSAAVETSASQVKLRIMETTDIHANIVNYDYYSLKDDHSLGFAKTATLIKQAKAEVQNSLLFDNGDLLQGTPLADYVAKIKPWEANTVHPIYAAMNLLGYDLGNYGNHEFNYGLDFLEKSVKTANFPYINANVYHKDGDNDPSNDVNYYTPYKILDKKVIDEKGNEQTVKVGVIGFVPPQITQWDKKHLVTKVVTHDIKKTAEKFIPKMKEEGAEIIVAIPHSGIGPVEYSELEENQVYQLSLVDGIDAILFGHTHTTFPGKNYNNIQNVDNTKGTINGVAAVQPGYWGSHLGIIDLVLEKDADGKWAVVDSQSTNRAIFDKATKTPLVTADPDVLAAVHDDHEHTIEYVSGPVGQTASDIYSYFSQVQDDPSVQIVADAQKQYIEKLIEGTEYDGLPVLSAAAPFKAGRDGVSDFTEIPAGDIAIKDTASLYKYPNTVMAVKLTGQQVKEWLEWSAGQFNQIDPNNPAEQLLVKPNNSSTGFPSYNFDIIDGLTYQIDVTQPQRYNSKGDVKVSDSERIINLQYNGEPIDLEQEFIVATNNYRATFTPIANPGGDKIIIESPDENRQVLVNYIRDNGTINPSADRNWSFAPINGDVNLVFYSSPAAQKYAENTDDIKYVQTLENGFAKYSVDLKRFDLTIMHTNDTHAHLENVARRITKIKEIRTEVDNSILVDAGDVFSGTLFFNQYLGQADVEFMNMIGYDVMVPGNHEFDKGPEVLAEFIKKTQFPIVSSNINYTKDAHLGPLFKNTIGQPGEGGNIYPAVILDVDGEKVGVFGLTTEETAFLAAPGKDVVFENYITKAKETVSMLQSQGINKIIGLTHLGFAYDKKLVEAVDGIDVVVGGHSHTQLDKAVVYNLDSEPTLIVQAQEYGNYLGRLDLSFSDAGILKSWNDQLININEKDANKKYVIAADPEAAALLAEYEKPLEELKNTIVGKTDVFLNGERKSVRSQETNLGNLITDSMLAKAKTIMPNTTIAIQNGGGIRASIDSGDISLGEVLTTMPFGNNLVTLDLSGAEVLAALENAVSEIEFGAGRFAQVSGLYYSFNRSMPAGSRIVDVFVETENGIEELDLDKMYTVATNAYIADGGDGYAVFKNAKNDGRMKELYFVDYEVFTEYLAKVGTVAPELEGRITEVIDPVAADIVKDGKKATATVALEKVKLTPANGTLPIDLTAGQDTETVEVSLTAEQISFLIAQNASITLFTDFVEVTIPVSNLVAADATFTITNLGTDEDSLTAIYDFTITQNGADVTTFVDDVTLSFKLDKEATNPSIFYFNEETSEWELVESYYDAESGEVFAWVSHFSQYTVKEVASSGTPGDGGSTPGDGGSTPGDGGLTPGTDDGSDKDSDGKELPDTATNSFNYLLIGMLLLSMGGFAYVIQRRRTVMKG
ncbi:bifunctional 2',3'-cyclic-nucleotide 2'-phosphodiesterase/3'-nucleotidase [Bacillus timonensis]|nr:bifunctional 2',3'-cyclic-nucleotide 2'-phosphodiesterase/3'-nucleotidase [Bacillus timonensis]